MHALPRRGFLRISASSFLTLFLASTSSLFFGGCSVFTDIKNWVPVGLAAFDSVLNLLESAGIINPIAGSAISQIINVIKAAFSQVVADVQAYQAITPPPAGALQKIEDTLQIIVTNFGSFFSSLSITDGPLISLISGLASIILSTIEGFINSIRGTSKTSARVGVSQVMGVNHKPMTITPKARNKAAFTTEFNALCIQHGHPEAQIKAA
jgi:hypothetical protein